MDERGNISLPSDIGATAMTEREICELFGIVAPTVRAGIKALCKSGVLKEYGIKRLIRLPERSYIEVYDFETIAALAFRIESFGAAKVRKVLLERIINGRKEKTTVFVSVVSDGKPNSRWKGLCTCEKKKRQCSCRYLRAASPKNIGRHDDISTCQHFNTPTCQHTNVPTLVCWYVPPGA